MLFTPNAAQYMKWSVDLKSKLVDWRSKCCVHIAYPNHPQKSMCKECGALLLQKVVKSGSLYDLRQFRTYVYQPLESALGCLLLLYLSRLGSTAKGGELNDMSICSQRFIPLTITETDRDKKFQNNYSMVNKTTCVLCNIWPIIQRSNQHIRNETEHNLRVIHNNY